MAGDQVQEILVELGKIDTKLDAALAQGADHESRLRAIECKGSNRWESLIGTIIAVCIGGLAGYLFK